MGVSNSALLDLISTTLSAYPLSPDFVLTQKYQNYMVFDNWGKKDKKKIQAGNSVVWNILVKDSGAAEQVQQYATYTGSVVNTQTQATAPWTYLQTAYHIERREILQNRKPARLVELLQSRRVGAIMDAANLLEEKAWTPLATNTTTIDPYSIPYWIVSPVAAASAGFNGTLPYAVDGSLFTTCAGIDASTAANLRWRNYNVISGTTDGTIIDTEIDKLTEMYRKMNFKSPVRFEMSAPELQNLRIYCGNTRMGEFEKRARQNNDNLGADIAKYQGMTLFNGVIISYVPVLDTYDAAAAATNKTTGAYPVYFINHSAFKEVVLEGDDMRESEPIIDRDQHNVFSNFIDLTYNFMLEDRRAGGAVMSYVTT